MTGRTAQDVRYWLTDQGAAAVAPAKAAISAGSPTASGRPAGEVVPASSPATPGLRTLCLAARMWANPAAELPVLPGAGGWDVGAA